MTFLRDNLRFVIVKPFSISLIQWFFSKSVDSKVATNTISAHASRLEAQLVST